MDQMRGQLGTEDDTTGLPCGEGQFAIKGGKPCFQAQCQLQVGRIVSGQLVFPGSRTYSLDASYQGNCELLS